MQVKLKHARNLFRSGLASCLLLSPALAAALGLGTIEHSSWLGEPLSATIEVLDPKGEYSPQDIRLRQIYPEEAAALGVDVVAIRVPLRTRVEREGGKLMIKLSTDRPVSEPFLNFMLALEWPSGKSYREYSLLLDPKDQQQIQPPVAAASNRQTNNSRANARPVLINEGQGNNRASRPVVTRPVANVPVSGGDNAEYWRVRPGQTLSQIAQKVRIDSNIQLQAVTNHLYRNNPQAFEGGIDQLQVGAQLRLPSKVEYAQMPRWRDEPVAALDSLSAQQAVQHEASAPAPQQSFAGDAKVDYTVQPGDTLSQVAQKMRQDPNIALQKVIDDIYQQNPDAFSGGKHSLRVGAKLELRGEAAMPTHKVSMNDVDVSDVSPEVPDASAFDGVNQASSSNEVNGRLRLSDANVSEEQILNGDLPSSEEMSIKQQIQVVSELTDKLNLENRELRQRIAAVDSSDSVELMQELVLLQSKQIEHFQQQLKETLSLLEDQKGNGSLDGTLASLSSADNSAATELPVEDASNESHPETGANTNELLSAEAVDDTPADNTELAESASNTSNDESAQATETESPDLYEGQGVGTQLADQTTAGAEETDAASKASLQADAGLSSNSLMLWAGLFIAAILAALAWLDFRRPGGFLNRFNKKTEEREEPAYSSGPAVAANEPVVRVRKRNELEAEESDEPVVQVPLAAPVDESEANEEGSADIAPMITGVAHWNRKDIPMLHVEESEVEDLSSDEPQGDENLNFDDFGLMNTISIDDLDINLDDGLEEGFKLDLDDEEEDTPNRAP
ncbi:LysM peptidoglycan-binding domain-containing protein [Pseudoteredinibacter isoporae]|uniref:FimV/HubP-related protein n=1 Tax=Pseudoteredinibacter isoporae TaxID=570281 RepID=UPI00310A735C